jgi:DNA-binding GntR family transcriptional regulator
MPQAAGRDTSTLTTRVHAVLEADIIDGRLSPGQRLHADALAAQYGMSRIPVREALRSLHEAGWVDIRPRQGVRVRQRTVRDLDELVELRSVVEGLVARWAAERRTAADLGELARAVGLEAAGAGAGTKAAAPGFADVLRQAAGNTVLAETSAGLEKRARFYFSTVAHRLERDWTEVHEELLGLVRDRDGGSAEHVARRHVEDTGSAVRTLLFAAR